MSVECRHCGNKVHDEDCPKYPYCSYCSKGKGRKDHEAECIITYTMPKSSSRKEGREGNYTYPSKEWFRNKVSLERGESIAAGSLSEPDVEQIKADIMKLANITETSYGHDKLLYSSDLCTIKKIFIKAGSTTPLQYSLKSTKSLTLISGMGYIQLCDHERLTFRLNEFVPVLIEPYGVNKIMASTDCLLIELSSPSPTNDVIKVEK